MPARTIPASALTPMNFATWAILDEGGSVPFAEPATLERL
jgi:hypothetical protein